jgi:uncharacterized protein (TIGR00299 family) protein
MLLAALVDLGIDRARLADLLKGVFVEGWSLRWAQVVRSGVSSLHLEVEVVPSEEHRSWGELRELLNRAKISPWARDKALAVFERLAKAEAKIHSCEETDVVFHEVGGIDSLIDIVGTCLAIEQLGVRDIYVGRLGVGHGQVRCAHGDIPLPSPATLELLVGWQLHPTGIEGECLTPTGAALLAELAVQSRPPNLRLLGTGYGAGTRDNKGRPNIVRASLVEVGATIDTELLVEMSSNIDDMAAEQLSFLQQGLLDAGAVDVWLSPVVMKKGRAGHVLKLLAHSSDAARLRTRLLRHSSTLGVRSVNVEREVLDRWIVEAETKLGPVRVKVGGKDGEAWHASPEYEDCAAIAKSSGIPLAEIYWLAMKAWEDLSDQ